MGLKIDFAKYQKYMLIILAAIVMLIILAAVFTVPFAYKGEMKNEPGSLAESGYVSLGETSILCQQIEPDVDARILLDGIKVIMLNISGEEDGYLHLVIRRDADNRVIKKIDYPFDAVVPGEWTEIPVHTILGIDSHSLEFSVSGDADPYLVTQHEAEASSWNVRMWCDSAGSIDSLAVVYNYRNIAPVEVRIYICFGIFVLIMLLLDFMFRQEVLGKYKGYILLGILIIMSIPIILISIHSRPCVDDFDYSRMTYQLLKSGNRSPISLLYTALRVDKHYYFNWQGLYISGFLLALQPGIFGEKVYWLGTAALIIFMASVIYIATVVVHKHLCGGMKQSFAWAVLFTVMILQGMPSPVEGLYWFNGMMNYVPFLFGVILNVSLMIELEYSEQWKRILFLIGSCIVSFVISGGNHITAFLNILILSFMSVAWGVRKRYGAVPSLLSAVIGFMVMYFAPGTAVRQTQFENAGILQTILEGGNQCLSDMRRWTNLSWICCILLVLPFAYDIIKSDRIKQLRVHPVACLLVSLAMLSGMRCVPYFAMQEFGAGRVDNVIWIAYTILSIINVVYFVVWLHCKKHVTLKVVWGRQQTALVGSILCFLLCISGNCQDGESTSMQAMEELITGRAQKYAATFDERVSLLQNASANQVLYVRALPESNLLKFDDITDNMDDWRNSAWTKYYGVPTVIGFEDE